MGEAIAKMAVYFVVSLVVSFFATTLAVRGLQWLNRR